jgi:hypothetical protein
VVQSDDVGVTDTHKSTSAADREREANSVGAR